MAQETQGYSSKEVDDIAKNLARTVTNNISSSITKAVVSAEYDKTFFCTILGVNQIFSSNVDEKTQNNIIKTYNIPEASTTDTYYTIKINGAFYCIKQSETYGMGQSVNVVAPKGDINKLYIETQGQVKSGGNVNCADYTVTLNKKDWVEGEDGQFTNTVECSWSKSTYKTTPICDIDATETGKTTLNADALFQWHFIGDITFEDKKVVFKSLAALTIPIKARVKVFE